MHAFRFAGLMILIAVALTTTLPAESPSAKTIDPSGTWRWDFDYEGNVIKNLLTLKQDTKGKLEGKLEASDRELKITDARVKDGTIEFGIEFDLDGQTIRGKYNGKLTAKKIDGETTFSTDQGEQTFSWSAARSLEPRSVLGTWVVKTETPEGTVESEMKVSERKGKLIVTNQSPSVEAYEADSVKIKDDKLIVASTTDYQGAELELTLRAMFMGDKMTGTLEYEIDGNTGEMTCEGVRKKVAASTLGE